jgi:hypothetical protein
MVLVAAAQALVALVPFARWCERIGAVASSNGPIALDAAELARARWHADRVRAAARRLPGSPRCLPQAIALTWLLREEQIAWVLRIAARPLAARDQAADEPLHAWVQCGGEVVLGELPGPWLVVVSLWDRG